MAEPVRIRDVLGAVGAKVGLAGAIHAGKIRAAWTEIVGEQMAAHVVPTSLRDSTLRLKASTSVWATEVGYLTSDIIARANAVLGFEAVSQVKIWVGTDSSGRTDTPDAPARRGPAAAPIRPTPETPHEAFERARHAWLRKRR